MINPSCPRTGAGSDSPPVPQASVEVPVGRVQPLCCQSELCSTGKEEALFFCLGVEGLPRRSAI